jgi:magnesium chelatase family protein
VVRRRVEEARAIQRGRLAGARGGDEAAAPCNARMTPEEIERSVSLGEAARSALEKAVESLGLSARAHHRILRVARTIADLGGEAAVTSSHLAEAIHYRALDRPLE